MVNFSNVFYRFSIWITRYAFVNFLWIIFTILGLIVFGFFPSTVSLYAIERKWIMGKEDIPIFKTYWKYYWKEFFKANAVGWILLFVGYVIVAETLIIRQLQNALIKYIAYFGIIIQSFLYIIAICYIFPIFVHFKLKLKDYFKWSIIIGITNPILSIFLIVSINLIYYLTFKLFPALLFFFGVSVPSYITVWGCSNIFYKYEEQKT